MKAGRLGRKVGRGVYGLTAKKAVVLFSYGLPEYSRGCGGVDRDADDDRPSVKNALDMETVDEFRAALGALSADRDIGVLVITGAGDAAFVSGADINDISGRGRDEGLAAINSSLFTEIDRFPRPTIAAINGYALGGGCELALAFDIGSPRKTQSSASPSSGSASFRAPAPPSACLVSSAWAGPSTWS